MHLSTAATALTIQGYCEFDIGHKRHGDGPTVHEALAIRQLHPTSSSNARHGGDMLHSRIIPGGDVCFNV